MRGGGLLFLVAQSLDIQFNRGALRTNLTDLNSRVDVLSSSYDSLSNNLWTDVNTTVLALNATIYTEVSQAMYNESVVDGM